MIEGRDIEKEIEELLCRVEAERGVKILYACESGSRAWEFASPDSDFDIRFLYVHPAEKYGGVFSPSETVEIAIRDDLDPGGWDVRKAARLLGKSNGALIEWLHSPIVYRAEEGFLEQWRGAAKEMMSRRHLGNHYRGLASQIWKGKLSGERVRAKDYLYVLRALWSAEWVVAKGTNPPVPFSEVIPEVIPEVSGEVREGLEALLEWKSGSGEKEEMERVGVLDELIERGLAEVVEALELVPDRDDPREEVERLFRNTVGLGVGGGGVGPWTVDRVREKDVLIFDCVAGSRAYGTAVEGSDEDRRGVFVAPASFLLGLDEVEQVSDERNDETYYEVGRFVELLLKNNPNALELLGMPEDCVKVRHAVFELLKPELFLSKLCAQTFGGYAMGQIRKARGLNKKIVNPQPEKRKGMLEYCYVLEGQGSVPLEAWLEGRGMAKERCGLVGVQHAPNSYAVFYDEGGELGYRGLHSPKDEEAVWCTSVPHEAEPVGWMIFNQDAFRAHCRAHREYWEWVEKRNEERYRTNSEHGRGYDSKNLMHTLRLLEMAEEIAKEGVLRVRRPNREWLLKVRAGEFAYDDLVRLAEEKLEVVEGAFRESGLPDRPDREAVNEVLLAVREGFRK